MRALGWVVLFACVLAVGAGSRLMAAPRLSATISVTVSGLGCNTATGTDTFDARSWSWGASNVSSEPGSGSGAGKAVLSVLALTRLTDACSPALLGGVITGKHFPTLSLTQYDDKGVMTATVTLSDVTISDWRIGSTSASAEAGEQVQLSFGKFSFTDVASNNKFCWDPAAGKAC